MGSVVALKFQGRSVRIETREDDDPWFVLADVCEVLEIENPARTADRLDDDEKGITTVNTLGGPQRMLIVSYPGLYSILLTSRKPKAKPFDRWVRHEVLEQIRKTGSYVDPLAMQSVLSPIKDSISELIESNHQQVMRGLGDITEGQAGLRMLLKDRREQIKDSVKAKHLRACHHFGGKCPCCSIRSVTSSDGSKANAEFDHHRRSNAPDLQHTWLICKKCHDDLSHDRTTREQVEPFFQAYQKRLESFFAKPALLLPLPLTVIECGPLSHEMTRKLEFDFGPPGSTTASGSPSIGEVTTQTSATVVKPPVRKYSSEWARQWRERNR